MNTLDIVSTVVDLIGTCAHVAKRIDDITGETKASGDPVHDIALEAMVLAEGLERLETILSHEKSAGSLGNVNYPKSSDVPSSESVDQVLYRIFRLCQISLTALSLELDKVARGGGESSGVRHLIIKTKLALRTHKMKDFLEQLRVYREAVHFQVQVLTLESADKNEAEQILLKGKETMHQFDKEEEVIQQRYPGFTLPTDHADSKSRYHSGSRTPLMPIPGNHFTGGYDIPQDDLPEFMNYPGVHTPNNRNTPPQFPMPCISLGGSPIPSRTSSPGIPTVMRTGSPSMPSLPTYFRNSSPSTSRSGTPAPTAHSGSPLTLIDSFIQKAQHVKDEGIFERLRSSRKQEKSVLMSLRYSAMAASAPISGSHEDLKNAGLLNSQTSESRRVPAPNGLAIPIPIPTGVPIPHDIQGMLLPDMTIPMPIAMPIPRPAPPRTPPRWSSPMLQSQ